MGHTQVKSGRQEVSLVHRDAMTGFDRVDEKFGDLVRRRKRPN
jgi:hypothetical protein